MHYKHIDKNFSQANPQNDQVKIRQPPVFQVVGGWKNTAPTRALAKHCVAAFSWSHATLTGRCSVYRTAMNHECIHPHLYSIILNLFVYGGLATVCPISLDPFYIVSNCIEWAKISWTYSIYCTAMCHE